MTQLVALLRGVNVGRANRIAMADFRGLLHDLGYGSPRTLLQSGNAIFEATKAQAAKAGPRIEAALKSHGVTSKVLIRTGDQVREAIDADPFTTISTDESRHFLGFLADKPTKDAESAVHALDDGNDRIRIIGTHVYLWMPEGLMESTLTKAKWERLLGTEVTARNFNTVTKLAALLS